MISREQAQDFLKTKLIENHVQVKLEKVNKLSGDAQQLGRLILNDVEAVKDKLSYGDWPSLGDRRRKEISYLMTAEWEGLDLWTGDYYRVLEAIFGDWAPFVKKAWQLKSNMMFQVGWTRRSFRAPNNPKLLISKKINWLTWLVYYQRYDLSLEDYVRYSVYTGAGTTLSYLFAGAIESKTEAGERVFKTAIATLMGEDDIAGVDRNIIKTLLITQRPDAWNAVEKLLLAAQRQEGLRQTILESLDETSLGAFKHFLRVIIDQNLGRFSATVRALDVWVGMGWDSPKINTINRAISMGLAFLENPETIEDCLDSKDNLELWMALWAKGCIDIMEGVKFAKRMLDTEEAIKQTLGLKFLLMTELEEQKNNIAYPFIKHENLMVAGMALFNLKNIDETRFPNLFSDLKALWERVPEKGIDFSGKLFEWYQYDLKREEVMSKLVDFADKTRFERFVPFYEKMDVSSRGGLARLFEKVEEGNTKQRELLFKMFVDKGSYVRSRAMQLLKNMELQDSENLIFEDVFTRKSADLRQGAISILLKQKDGALLGSIGRLISSSKGEQRLAALDILTQLKKEQRLENELIEFAQKYNERPKITAKERIILKELITENQTEYSAKNGFGLYDVNELTRSPEPKLQPHLDFSWDEEKIISELKKLDELIETNKDFEYTRDIGTEEATTYLVGNKIIHKTYNWFNNRNDEKWTPRAKFEDLPLWEIWEKWWQESSLTEWELERLTLNFNRYNYYDEYRPDWLKEIRDKYNAHPEIDEKNFRYPYIISEILDEINNIYYPENLNDLYLDITEHIFASIPKEKLNEEFGEYGRKFEKGHGITWRDENNFRSWENRKSKEEKNITKAQIERAWHLKNWVNQSAEFPKDDYMPDLKLTAEARKHGVINENDVFHKLFHSVEALRDLSRQSINHFYSINWFEEYPFLEEFYEVVKARILDIELKRGDTPTAVTRQACVLEKIYGIDYLVRILQALGKDNITRGGGYYYGNQARSKKDALSDFLKNCHPKKEETFVDFKKAIDATEISKNRLLEVAVYAPQWISMIEKYLKYKGLTEVIWWLHAHTKDYSYAIQNKWESDVNKHTPLTAQDLVDGGVDVDWFHRAYKKVGKKIWEELYKSARYISDGNGHKRAQLFADAMLGNFKIKEAIESVTKKRKQDSVRALGLIPLSRRIPEKDILKRYQLIQKFKKESKQFGSQRQASEALCVRIGLENLARTAGYSDPIRLTWAMETKEAKEILENAQIIEKENVTIQLFVDNLGKADLITEKDGKKLKSIPAKLRKDKTILNLKEQVKILRDQYKRTRKSLEEAMIRGDVFSLSEIRTLMSHPVVSPMLRNLVLVTQPGKNIGFFDENELHSPDGKMHSISKDETFRIAHCTDLHESKIWSEFQRDCFSQKRIQPFKQIFRELYLPTEDELTSKTVSRRYAGHQVQPKKTVALLKGRGWTVDYDEGLQKVYHKENFVVRIYAIADWFTPSDVEAPTLETLRFEYRDSHKEVPFSEIDPRIFSEVMRDVDLVVSVAHVGGIDPEASHSTIEMRQVLVEETSLLLSLKNVKIKGNHILINGEIGNYSVHLGSGIVHRQPGGYVAIIPVHGQHRGRLFLPFVDDDPKSAEILSKVLLLSEDGKIKDPTVLRQLVG